MVVYMLDDSYGYKYWYTHVARRTQNPQWNYSMDFGVGEWFRFNIIGSDWEWSPDTSLSKWNSYFPNSHTSQEFVEMEAYSGYVLFDYHFEIE